MSNNKDSIFLSILSLLSNGLLYLHKLMTGIAAVMVAVTTVLIVTSSIMRYIIARPFHFTEEICALFFMSISIITIPYVLYAGRHIRIRIIFDRVPESAQDILSLISYLITLCFTVFFIKESWSFCWETLEVAGTSQDASIPLFPWMALIPLSLAIFGLQLSVMTIEKIKDLARP